MNKILVLLLCFVFVGCGKKKDRNTFFKKTPNKILSVVLDLSVSYGEKMKEGGLSYDLIQRCIKTYFSRNVEGSSLLISTITDSGDRNLIWQGEAKNFSKEFRKKEDFYGYIYSGVNPYGSKVYRSLEQTVKHMLSYGEKTKMMILVLSDMGDTDGESRKVEFFQVLEKYKSRGGEVAFYFVASSLSGDLKRNLMGVGYDPPMVMQDFQRNVSLPRFK